MIRRIALPGNGPGLAVRGLRDGDVIVVVDQGVPFPQPPKPFENLVVFLRAARLAQPFVQVSKSASNRSRFFARMASSFS